MGDLPPDETRSLAERASPSVRVPVAPPPTIDDRYVLLGELGEGGMAVVYAAFDRALDRKVALKILKDESRVGADARMRREAQALARLKHPHVVAVYDVGGLSDGRVFVAMEFVEGTSLRGWLASEPRSREAILAMFLQAGEGLVAAHAAGLVHRDFKPDNVLVGDDGVARVADFGLARMVGHVPSRRRNAVGDAPVVAATVTHEGAVVGTPRYMAPEQLRGDAADERSDQFAFGVALYEALHRAVPFEAKTLGGLLEEMERGPPPPRRGDVPAWLNAIVTRALSPDPSARFASMRDVLAALRTDPTRKRRRGLAVAAVVLAIGAVAFATARVRQHERLVCAREAPLSASAWSEARRAHVLAAFDATGQPFAADAAREATRRLDATAKAIDFAQRDACEATRIRHEQPPAVLDLRRRCLAQRVAEVDALASLFERADVTTVRNAVQSASALAPVSTCADVAALQGPAALPSDAPALAKIDDVRARVAQVLAMTAVGKARDAVPIAEQAAASAAEAGYAPVEAEAQLALGRARDDAGDYLPAEQALERAYSLAEFGRHDLVRLQAAMAMAKNLAQAQRRLLEARVWDSLLDDVARRLGDPLQFERVEAAHGLVASNAGRYDDARTHYERALTLSRDLPGFDPVQTASLLNSLGAIARDMMRWQSARDYLVQARDMWQAELGPDHPLVGTVFHNLADLEIFLGDPVQGAADAQRSVDIATRAYGEDSPRTTAWLVSLGDARLMVGEAEEALAIYRRDLDAQTEKLGGENGAVAWSRSAVAQALARLGKDDEARREAAEAARVARAVIAPDSRDRRWIETVEGIVDVEGGDFVAAIPILEATVAWLDAQPEVQRHGYPLGAIARAQLCEARLARGDAARAREDGEHAAGDLAAVFGERHVETARARACAGAALLALRDEGALAALESVTGIFDAIAADPRDRASARFALARAQAAHGDAARARELATRAQEELASCEGGPGGTVGRLRVEVARWLASR